MGAGFEVNYGDDNSRRNLKEIASPSLDPYTYVNVWIADLIGVLGWATFPCMYLGTADEWRDGVVIDAGTIGDLDDDPAFYQEYWFMTHGRVLTHEV